VERIGEDDASSPAGDPPIDGGLPVDSDLDVGETPAGSARPIHLSPAALAIVALGGAVGTAAREAITLALPRLGQVPIAILAINVTGAFLLGLLLESLVRRGPDVGRRRRLRLLLGTGALGGFTTYSALAVDGALLLGSAPVVGVAYTVGTLLLGAVATTAGIAGGAALASRRTATP